MDQGDQLTATSNCSNSEDEHSVATAVDANMASEESEADDSASMKLEEHWKNPKMLHDKRKKRRVKSKQSKILTKTDEKKNIQFANLLLYQRLPPIKTHCSKFLFFVPKVNYFENFRILEFEFFLW